MKRKTPANTNFPGQQNFCSNKVKSLVQIPENKGMGWSGPSSTGGGLNPRGFNSI